MRTSKYSINFASLKYSIKDHFVEYKKAYIICLVTLILGILTGVLTAFKFIDNVTIENITDTALIDYIRKNTGWLAFLVSRMFAFIFLVVLIVMLGLNKWSSFLSLLVILYRAYLIGLNCAIFIILFNISGILNVFLVYLPCQIIYLFALLMITAIVFKNCWFYSKYKQNILSPLFWSDCGNYFVFAITFVFVSLLLEIILFPTFCSAFFLAI